MENRILLEGINVMLKEIWDNVKSNPELEIINSKLVAIEQVCNELAEKKLVTENLIAGFISFVLKQMIEMNENQDEKTEKLKGYILGHHKFIKEQIVIQQEKLNMGQERIESQLNEMQENQGLFRRFRQWIKQFGI